MKWFKFEGKNYLKNTRESKHKICFYEKLQKNIKTF